MIPGPSESATVGHVGNTIWGIFNMVGLIGEFKVVDGIIETVSVDMMDHLILLETPPQVLFHDKSVFGNAATIDGDLPISITVDRSIPMGIDLSEQGISEFLKPEIVEITKAIGFISSSTSRNSANKIGFALCQSHSDVGISIFSGTLKMLTTHIPTSGWKRTVGNGADFSGFHDIPPKCELYAEIAQNVKGICDENRVNSGKPLTGYAEGNPEPSRECTLGRCRDYRRGLVPLITG